MQIVNNEKIVLILGTPSDEKATEALKAMFDNYERETGSNIFDDIKLLEMKDRI